MNDGGQAFPGIHQDDVHEGGMTLRDYFAGQAVIGLIFRLRTEDMTTKTIKVSYQIADVMIAARNKE